MKIKEILEKYLKIFPDERKRQDKLLEFLKDREEKQATNWNNFEGHIVASGFIYSIKQGKFLVLYHNDLKMFLYPGGHVDTNDKTILDAAIREVKEETGIYNFEQFEVCNDKLVPIDIDTHEIPYNERLNLPKHYHFDFRYLFIVNNIGSIKLDEGEHSSYKWISVRELAEDKNYGKILNKFENIFYNSLNKEITKDAHNDIANKYYKAYKDDKSDLEYIDKFLKKCKHKILDLGCGMGHYSKYIKSKGLEVVGVDFASEMLKIARETTSGIKYVESDICDLPDNLDKDFDGVLIAYVLQHLTKEETKTCLVNLHKYLDKDADLLIFLREGTKCIKEKEPFNPEFEYEIKEYTKEEITRLLEKCDYKVVRIEDKPFVNDENSLCPRTMVVYTKNNK